MRRVFVGFASVAMVLGLNVVAGTPAHASTATKVIDASCTLYGHLTISPGITLTDQPQTITLGSDARMGSVAGTCPRIPPNFGAVVVATFTAPSLYCANDTSDNDPLVMGAPASGRVKIRWPDGDREVWRAHLSLAATTPQTLAWTGTDTKGWVGDKVTARTLIASTTTGHCSAGSPPITQMQFGASPNERPARLITFSHTN